MLRRRRIHKVEMQQIIDSQRFQCQHRVGQVAALQLRNRRRQHLILVRVLCVQSEALARPCTARAPGSLARTGLRDRRHHKRVHAELGVVHFLLGESGVHDVKNPVDGKTGLRDVGGDDDFATARRGGVENPGLHFARKRRVDGEDDELRDVLAERLHAFVQNLGGRVNFFLSGEEQQDITGRLEQMDLHHSDQRRIEIVRLGLLGVQNLHRKCAPGNRENRTVEKIRRKLFSIERRGRHDDLKIFPPPDTVLQQPKQHVR
mmetsp:Transcript_1749/g.4731  ORF Transcript_1749/g.4731 Transcript_1749/m.4731 type:complete len:261 (-) Transcript_1749:217-999(-)